MTLDEYIMAALEETVKYARSIERVRGAMVAVGGVLAPIKEVLEVDSDLGPEMVAAATSLDEAHHALERAGVFLTERYDARMQTLHDSPKT